MATNSSISISVSGIRQPYQLARVYQASLTDPVRIRNEGHAKTIHQKRLDDALNAWIYNAAATSLRIRNLLSQGDKSLYSFLEKEIHVAEGICQEGEILAGLISYDHPRLASYREKLPDLIQEANQARLDHPQEIEKDKKIEAKWMKLRLSLSRLNPRDNLAERLPISVLENHADCARFLIKSGLIYSIVGYLETSKNKEMHGIKLDYDGHPLIMVEGDWTRWEVIKDRLVYDADNLEIISHDGENGTVRKWSYFHEEGLVPVDRFHYDKVFPIYTLSQEEYARLIQHAGQFYHAGNPDPNPQVAKNCVVQFFTSPRYTNSSIAGSNLHRNIPVHVGIRLITADRRVYSFGLQMPESEQRTVNSNFSIWGMLSTFLMTATANISMLDYEEFREHEGRMVTSCPVSADGAQHVLERLNQLNAQGQLRFSFARQNCTSLMLETMQEAGLNSVDVSTPVWEVISEALSVDQLPLIGSLIGKVQRCISHIWNTVVNATPKIIQDGFSWIDYIVFYIPRKVRTIFYNLLMLKLGAGKWTTPMAENLQPDILDHRQRRIQNFSCVIPSWTDVFKEESTFVNHSKSFLDWQRQQGSTHTFANTGCPSLCIVPPAAAAQVVS